MIEIPVVILVMFFAIFAMLGFMGGMTSSHWLTDKRRERALSRATPTWEARVESDAARESYGSYVSRGQAAVVLVRKVRRAGNHVKVLQQIEVARMHGDEPPEKLMKAVDRAHEMVQTLALTGVA